MGLRPAAPQGYAVRRQDAFAVSVSFSCAVVVVGTPGSRDQWWLGREPDRLQDRRGDRRLHDEGDDSQASAAAASKRVEVVDPSQERSPIDASAGPELPPDGLPATTNNIRRRSLGLWPSLRYGPAVACSARPRVGTWDRRKAARPEDPAHEAARRGAQVGSAPALGAGVLLPEWQTAHAVGHRGGPSVLPASVPG